jgi:hypothetical protein
MKIHSKPTSRVETWLHYAEVLAGLALYWWQRLATLDSSIAKLKFMFICSCFENVSSFID